MKKIKATPDSSKKELPSKIAVRKLPNNSHVSFNRKTLKVEVPIKEISEEWPRSALSSLDSDDNNAELWGALSEVLNFGINTKNN